MEPAIGINGFDLREIACHADGNGPVLFQDSKGTLHRIYTAITTRCDIGDHHGPATILRESMAEDFILRVYPPTPELQARIDEYNKTHE